MPPRDGIALSSNRNTMSQNRSRHISTLGSRVTSVISVTLVLFVLGIMGMLGMTIRGLSDDVRRNMGFIIKMERGCPESTINNMKRVLGSIPGIGSHTYRSSEDILAEESAYLGGEDIAAMLEGANPYAPEFDVKVTPEYAKADSIARLGTALEAAAGVDEIITEDSLIEDVDSNLRRIGSVLLVVATALLLISFVLINNTVSLSVYSRRFIIHTMKLVGATPGFIMRPFIRAGAVNGLIAGAAASVLLGVARVYAAGLDPVVESSLSVSRMAVLMAVTVVLGVIICSSAAAVATKRYLRTSYDDMFLK